ncbi:hypothetical protein Dda_0547 [Drechslerella dactyloides]|uniref:F-box domain-containing protein n=1 Tax=Drechslerella dactyloides TaxID=74499 RepID=A0AAD6NM37_DREDA|nr:hypothetical protein Dda_0547 [Drechslerella dactyloides]
MSIISAMEFEMSAVRYMLDDEHPSLPPKEGDPNKYFLGDLGGHNVVLAWLPEKQGKSAAAHVAANLQRSFPSVMWRLFVGIGGGAPSGNHDIRLGDVVVSKPSGQHNGIVQYDLGKQTEDGFTSKGILVPQPSALVLVVDAMISNQRANRTNVNQYLLEFFRKNEGIYYRRSSNEPDHLYQEDCKHNPAHSTCVGCDHSKIQARPPRQSEHPEIHYGLVASGDSVIKNTARKKEIIQQFGDVLCFEMEVAGVATELPCITIRGISDYADSHKNDRWHMYAAATAAATAKELLSHLDIDSKKQSADALANPIPGTLKAPDFKTWAQEIFPSEEIPTSVAANIAPRIEPTQDDETKCHRVGGHQINGTDAARPGTDTEINLDEQTLPSRRRNSLNTNPELIPNQTEHAFEEPLVEIPTLSTTRFQPVPKYESRRSSIFYDPRSLSAGEPASFTLAMPFGSSNVQLAAAEKLQADARAAYRKGNYQLAIDKFTEVDTTRFVTRNVAMDMQPPIMMALLDGRAAAYEKAERPKLALKDAKTMMGYEKANPKGAPYTSTRTRLIIGLVEVQGYLRAGKVLHLMDKPSVAIDIYKLGLKHVAPSDPNVGLLKGILDKAVAKQTTASQAAAVKNRYDPMQVLPLELLEMVLQNLTFRAIVALQRVSRVWHAVISGNARFWTTLDFTGARKPVGKTALKKYISQSKYALTRAVVNRIQGFSDTTLVDMVTMCKELEYLKLMDGFFGSSLTHAVGLARSLRVLVLRCQIPYGTLEGLLGPEMVLEELECWQLGPVRVRSEMKFGNREPCRSLKRLLINFADPDGKDSDRRVALDELVAALPNVEELQLNKIACIGTGVIDMTSLSKLRVFACRHSRFIEKQITYPPSLQVLDLANSSTVLTDMAIAAAVASDDQPDLRPPQAGLRRLNLTKTRVPLALLHLLLPPGDAGALTHLRVGWSRDVGFAQLYDGYFSHNALAALEELSVEGDYEFRDSSLPTLYPLPGIKRVNFSWTSVTSSGVWRFLRSSKSAEAGVLEEMVLNGRERMSEDVKALATTAGVRIVQVPEGSREWQVMQGEDAGPFARV